MKNILSILFYLYYIHHVMIFKILGYLKRFEYFDTLFKSITCNLNKIHEN